MRWVLELVLLFAGTVDTLIDHDYNSIEEEHSIEITYSSDSLRRVRYRNCTRDTDIIDKLLNGTGYNKFRIPQDDGMTVYVEIWIQAITSIDELTNDFEMDIYITEKWLDPALNFEKLSPCKGNLSLNHQVLDRLWTPNSCFINSKVAQIHDSPFRSVFLMLYPNGTVMVNYRVRVKGPCSLDLSNFPLDLQRCGLIYESFNYNNQEVRMRWAEIEEPVVPLAEIMLPDFDLFRISAHRQEKPYPAGMWDELHMQIMFERRFIWYFMQAYLPTYLSIFISWVSFFLGTQTFPARTMLGVNALIAMIFQFGNIMKNLPRVSYVKAIDVWMLASMTFVFCSLLELAIVGYKVKNEAKNASKGTLKKSKSLSDGSPRGSQLYEKRFMFPAGCNAPRSVSKTSSASWPPEKIDQLSSIMFPLTFLIFNIVYWSYYLQRKQEISEYMQKL